MPFLFVYGVGLSILGWRLARRMKAQNRQLQRLSLMDPLVEPANRGFLIQRAQQALDNAYGQGGMACLAMTSCATSPRRCASSPGRAIRLRGWAVTSSLSCCAGVPRQRPCRWPRRSGIGCAKGEGRAPGSRHSVSAWASLPRLAMARWRTGWPWPTGRSITPSATARTRRAVRSDGGAHAGGRASSA